MCFRITRRKPNEDWLLKFRVQEISEDAAELKPSYNIAPGLKIAAVIFNSQTGKNRLVAPIWGLVPFWARNPAIGRKLANARSETVDRKPSFREAFRHRRCIIIADGYYEWITDYKNNKVKLPYFIHLKNHMPFGIAGLYDYWEDSQSHTRLLTCTLITTEPNELIKPIHNRMPVILEKDLQQVWLRSSSTEELHQVLHPYRSDLMETYRVSTFVNRVGNDSPECIMPI